MELITNPPRLISILMVEDDEEILNLQTAILAAKFPDVVFYTAVNGRLGLELFKAHTPAIVISDINMSEMCGVQMSNNIRAIKPETKIIALTGKPGEFGENGKFILRDSEGIMIEFDHFITKPFGLSELYTVIEQCLAEI